MLYCQNRLFEGFIMNEKIEQLTPLSKAQFDFRNRKNEQEEGTESGLDFNTWYHPEDVERLLWAFFQRLPEKSKAYFLGPYVFLDNLGHGAFTFEKAIKWSKDLLIQSGKLYFPFIMKPETGGAHYIAGILRRTNTEDKDPVLFLFNPVGYTLERFKKRLRVFGDFEISGVNYVLSPYTVQSEVKEATGERLVSCGPFCVEFIQYALEHPEWIDQLDNQFILPDHLMAFISYEKEQYQIEVIKIRQKHDDLLSTIADKFLEFAVEGVQTILDFYAGITDYLFNKLNRIQQRKDADEFERSNSSDAELDLTFGDMDSMSPEREYLEGMTLGTKRTLKGSDTIESEEMPFIPKTSIETRQDVVVVQKEIDRLRSLSDCFGSSTAKADAIEKALNHAIARKCHDVRQVREVREALGSHRLFSFFGLWKARALDNVDRSYDKESTLSIGGNK